MKRALVASGLALFVLAGAVVAYLAWFVKRAVVDRLEVRASSRYSPGFLEIEVTASGNEDGAVITVISMDRGLRDALGLSPPEGFKPEALPLEDGEKDDEETAAFVAKYNLEKVRYTGRLPVSPRQPGVLRFAVERPAAAAGQVQLQHERTIGVGGSIAFVSVTVGPPPRP